MGACTIIFASLASSCAPRAAQEHACTDFARDFDRFWAIVRERYVYLPEKAVDWDLVRAHHRPHADTAGSRRAWLGVLERAIDELYDPHLTVRVNSADSPRLIPTGLDLWAEWRGDTAVITELRPGFSAEQAGLRPGMRILEIGGTPVAEAARAQLGPTLTRADSAAMEWALLRALAGHRSVRRQLRVHDRDGRERVVHLDAPGQQHPDAPDQVPRVEWRMLDSALGYIRLNDLSDTRTVAEFDAALEQLRDTRGLVLDLRNTPGGGNTGVAEPILGRFVRQRVGYQRVLPSGGSAYTRQVDPRGPWTYTAPLTVLVGRWTASMGEGLAIGLDAIGRATVVGSRMAGLAGAIEEMVLPCSRFAVAYPAARLHHLDGTPRELYVPEILVDPSDESGDDPVLRRARELMLEQPPA